MKFTVTVQPRETLLGDPITVELTMVAPDEFDVHLPTADALGDLEIRAVDSPDPSPSTDGLAWRRTFTIEGTSPGVLRIPPLIAKAGRKSTDSDAETDFAHELRTDAADVQVLSVLSADDAVTRPREITGTLTPPQTLAEVARDAAIIGAVAGALTAAAFVGWKLWRRSHRPPPPVAPEVWALAELAKLENAAWGSADEARVYYYDLSEIVRAYIEKKFALAAPEMTTEEFLRTLFRNRAALPYDAERLRAFLEACDVVKYAAFQPQREDATHALETARAFVNQTAAAAAARTLHETPGGQAA